MNERPSMPDQPDSDDLLKLVVESSADLAIFTIDDIGNVTSWNLGAERLLGFGHQDIMGHNGDVIFTAEDRAAGAPEAERAEARTSGRAEDERWHVRKDGSSFWGSGLLIPLRGNVNGFAKILRDRTSHHQAEEELRRNEARFRLLATSVPQLVFVSRGTGERTWGSPQWEVFTGLSDAASRGTGWLDAVHPDDRRGTIAAWRDAVSIGEYYFEHRIRRSDDGEYRWHQTRAKPVAAESAGAADWIGTSTDIHELRGLHERQQVLLSELQHRTRNLLAVVQSIARKTLRSSGSLQNFGPEFEGRLRALSRVQGLLEQAEHESIELRALVEAELMAHLERGSHEVVVQGPPVAVPAASAQTLALALHELTTNAVKYGALHVPEGRLSIRWDLAEHDSNRVLVIDWRESGVKVAERRPARRGYGSELIERALTYQLKAHSKLDFGPDGVHCTISLPWSADKNEAATA